MKILAKVCVAYAALVNHFQSVCCFEIAVISPTNDDYYDNTISESGDRVEISYSTNSFKEIAPNVLQFIGGNLSAVELSCQSTKDKTAFVRWKYHGIEARKVEKKYSEENGYIINLTLGPPVVKLECSSVKNSSISNSVLIYTGENKSPYLYNHGKLIRATVLNETTASLACILRYPITKNSSMELQLFKDGNKVEDNKTDYLSYYPELGYILKLNQLKNPLGTYECRVENSTSVNDSVHVRFDKGEFVRVNYRDRFLRYFYAGSPQRHKFECQLPTHIFENHFKWYYQWKNGNLTELVAQSVEKDTSSNSSYYSQTITVTFPYLNIVGIVCASTVNGSTFYNNSYEVDVKESFPPEILGQPSDERIIYTPGRNITCLTRTQPIDDFGWLKNGNVLTWNDTESNINERHFPPYRTTLILKPTLAYTNYTCFVSNFYGTAQFTYRVQHIENIDTFIKVEYKENSSSFYAEQRLPQPFECKLPTHIFDDKFDWFYQWKNGTFTPAPVINVENVSTSNSSFYSQTIKTSFPSVDITGIVCVGTVKGSDFRYNNSYPVFVTEQPGFLDSYAPSIVVVVTFIIVGCILTIYKYLIRTKKQLEALTPNGSIQCHTGTIPLVQFETNRINSQTGAEELCQPNLSTEEQEVPNPIESITESEDDKCPSEASQSIPDDESNLALEDSSGFEHTMNNMEVKAVRPLKEGNFGEVYLGILHNKNLNTSIELAIKAYKHDPEASKAKKKYATSRIKKEMAILKSLEHPNVVAYIGGVTSYLPNDYSAHIFFEYCEGGDLESYLSRFSTNVDNPFYFHDESKDPLDTLNGEHWEQVLRISHLMSWAEQCANGMKYLASKAILHRDLAARNVLLALGNVVNVDPSSFIAKITDFDLSKVLQDINDTYKTVPGENKPDLPFRLMSLEALKHLTFTTKSDVWSLGVLYWEIFRLCTAKVNKEKKKKCTPYNDHSISNPQELIAFLESGGRLSIPPCAPKEMKKIMKKCWRKTPRKRPKFCAIHYKLKKYNNPDDRIDQLSVTADAVGSSNNDDQLPTNYSRLGEVESNGRIGGGEVENFEENDVEGGKEASAVNEEQGEERLPGYVTESDLYRLSAEYNNQS